MKVISYGGGVQSTAMIVLAIQGRIPNVEAALFANVGDDSEHPASLVYVRDVMIPWAAERNFPVHELHRTMRDGSTRTLWNEITRDEGRAIKIPVRMDGTNAPGNRSCTSDYKVKVVNKWLRQHGATKENPAEVCIGISTDEFHRASNRRPEPTQVAFYPLLDLGMDRVDCQNVIRNAGLPVPPKSSCFFCPFHRLQTWQEMRRDEPELFWKSVELERIINTKRAALNRQPVYLTDRQKPLDEAAGEAGPTLFDDLGFNDGKCDEGYCWT
jgi:hypothetical protein